MSKDTDTTEYIEDAFDADDTDPEIPLSADISQKIKKLKENLAQCEAEKRKNLEDVQRARADFLNSKRRLEEQAVRDKERAGDKIIEDLLMVIDSFDTARADKARWDNLDPQWRVGIDGIYNKLFSILKDNNIECIDPLGLPFNPLEHEAVSNIHVGNAADVDTITAVLQKGFKRKEILIRPARVVVGIQE